MAKKTNISNLPQLAHASLEQASDPIFLVARDGKLIEINHAACESLGYTRDELLTLSIANINPAFVATQWKMYWTALNKAKVLTLEALHRTRNGRIFPVEISTSLIEYGNQQYSLIIARDIASRIQTSDGTQRTACYDALTGLPTDTLLHDRLEQLIAWSARDKKGLSVLVLGMSGFENLSSSLSNIALDQLLKITANRLKLCVREGDTVSRTASGEFVLLLRDSDTKGAKHVAKIILKSLSVSYDLDDKPGALELSSHAVIGISVFPRDARDPLMLLERAKAARHLASSEGSKTGIRFFADRKP